ncbi:MAG: prepilin-type N-terminal cleavage/methylation domain-containing protein [Lentisphaeria bacterium]|nr:prepilin-type N-terminal cleavage/methylation domain-containing protein [Lentisphaeria bacterium]
MKTKKANMLSAAGAKQLKKNQFTLLELLIVVSILAIIGGGMISAYDGMEENAAQATATRDIAALDQAIRTFRVVEDGDLPNNVETLMSATPTTFSFDASIRDNVATDSGTYALSNILGSKVAGKFTVTALTADQMNALRNAGIDKLRYIDTAGDDEVASNLNIFNDGGSAAVNVGPLSEISIPQHAFEAPREGDNRNRGRGYQFDISGVDDADADDISVAVWNAGTNGYNNIKVNGAADAVLVGFGIGNASTIVASDSTASLASSPFYGNVGKEEYSHYIMLVDVSQDPAQLVAVVDARGDFLDEEFAEATDQKQ